MEVRKSRASLGRGSDVTARAAATDWALPAVCTAHCLLALSTLLSPATFGPIGALMCTVFVVGLSAALRIPLHEVALAKRDGQAQSRATCSWPHGLETTARLRDER